MIFDPDYEKITKKLNKRALKAELAQKLLPKKESIQPEAEPERIKLSGDKLRDLAKQKKSLNVRREQLNEAWRLAVEEGDDRETDALSVALKLLQENTLEINKVEDILSRADQIDSMSNGKANLGSIFEIEINGIPKCYTLVDPVEANPIELKISVESELGKALLKGKVGDSFILDAKHGSKAQKVKILKIR